MQKISIKQTIYIIEIVIFNFLIVKMLVKNLNNSILFSYGFGVTIVILIFLSVNGGKFFNSIIILFFYFIVKKKLYYYFNKIKFFIIKCKILRMM